jgi:hypothetical protein
MSFAFVDNVFDADYIPIAFPAEGRSCRTLREWGRVRRLRARLVTSHSGGVGAPPGGHYEPPASSSLTAEPLLARSSDARQPDEGNWRGRADGKTDGSPKARPGAEGKRRDGAPQGAAILATRIASKRTDAPSGAPSPSIAFRGQKPQDGVPGAAKNTGDLPRSQIGCLTFESVKRRLSPRRQECAFAASRRMRPMCASHLIESALRGPSSCGASASTKPQVCAFDRGWTAGRRQ